MNIVNRIIRKISDGLSWRKSVYTRNTIFFLTSLILKKKNTNPESLSGILVIKNDRIGDFLVFLPSFRLYRRIFPGKKITLLANMICQELIAGLSDENLFDEIIFLDEKKYIGNFYYNLKFLQKLRSRSYEQVICPIFSRSAESEYLVAMAISERKIGFDGDCTRLDKNTLATANRHYSKLVTVPHGINLEIERNVIFAQGLGYIIAVPTPLTIRPKIENQRAADILLNREKVGTKYAVLFPGAYQAYRSWPLERYAEIAKYLSARNIKPVICGSEQEIILAQKILSQASGCVVLSGKTDIWTLAAILQKAMLYIGSETGILQLAIAVQTPVVCILGGGHFGRYFPYGDPATNRAVFDHNMRCFNDNWECVKDKSKPAPCIDSISVKDVITEIDTIINRID